MTSRGRLVIGAIAALIALAVFPGGWSWVLRTLASWAVGVGVYLAIAWHVMLRADADETRRRCRRDDPYRGTIDTLLIVAGCASVVAVCVALRTSGHGGGPADVISVGVPMAAMVLSWLLIHTLHALHYARLFYDSDEPNGPPRGGLEMHQSDHADPDYRDFLYIAFAIACTFGVTDTEITAKHMRRKVTYHSLLSFGFGTILLALAVNVATNLLSGDK